MQIKVLLCLIRRAIVNYDDFNSGIRLFLNAANRVIDVIRDIEARHHN
jgi:hypothetical protein